MIVSNRKLHAFFPAAWILLLATVTAWAQTASPSTSSAQKQAPAQQEAPPQKPALQPGPSASGVIPPSEPPQVLQQLNAALEGMVAKVSPAVVQIQVTGYSQVENKSQDNTALIARQSALGSGVILDPSGYIMTNAHVVEGAQRIRVVLPVPSIDMPMDLAPIGKNQVFEGKLIGLDKDIDLALIKINGNNLPTLPLGNGRRIHQGQLVFAVGSPEGLQSTATMGVVSAVARQIDPDKPMVYIQTDAPINPGNSGGPLVDMEGYVVGINTFILTQAGGSEGLGFAIPARVVNFAYHSFRKYGHLHRSIIGAQAQTITPALAQGLSLPRNWGLIISDVKPDGPAEAAGLKIGDIVLAADDRHVETLPVFVGILYLHPVDQVLKLDVLRGTEKKTLYIPVTEQKDKEDQIADLSNAQTSLVSQLAILAVTLDDRLRSMLPDLRNPNGVVVVGRAADLAGPDTGLTTGDIIHSVNGAPIASVDALRASVKAIKSGDSVAMQIEREGHFEFVSFEME